MKRILELFATGTYSLTGIRSEFLKANIIGEKGKRPMPISSISYVLRNPFYYGVFLHKNEIHQGSHVPMISKKMFDDIQTAMVAFGRPRHDRKKDRGFLFRHFAMCGSCGYSITAERHTKKSGLQFHYYRCTHKSKKEKCEERSFVRQEKFLEEVKRNVGLVSIPDEWKEKFLARIETWESDDSQDRQTQIDAFKAELILIKQKIDRINNGFADGSLDILEFKELKNPLVSSKADLEQKIVALEKGKANRLEPLRNFILEANQAEKWVKEENWLEMKSFLQKVGSNRLLRAQTLTVSFKKPANLLAETVLAVRSTNDFSQQSSRWWSLSGSNR